MIYSDSAERKNVIARYARSENLTRGRNDIIWLSSNRTAVPRPFFEGDLLHAKAAPHPCGLIVLLAFLGVAQAQQAAPAQPKPRRFLMWKAASPTTTVYLVGSIHLGDSSMYPLPKEVESAFAAAKVLAVEINIKNADQAKMIGLVQKYGMYTGDDSLTKHLPKETQAALDDYCANHNVPRHGHGKTQAVGGGRDARRDGVAAGR